MATPVIRPFLNLICPPEQEIEEITDPEAVEITRLEVVGFCPVCSHVFYRSKSQPEAPIRKSCNCTVQDTKDIWKLMLYK